MIARQLSESYEPKFTHHNYRIILNIKRTFIFYMLRIYIVKAPVQVVNEKEKMGIKYLLSLSLVIFWFSSALNQIVP